MSEYQYYDFLAVDRPLSRDQMAELRKLTSRATITPTRLTNVYHWGDFKGDPIELLERHFDAHVYDSNFGTRQLQIALPRKAVDVEALRPYRAEGAVELLERGDRVILSLVCEDDEPWGWVEEEESEAWMGSLISLRAEIMNGDLRALYLGWLRGVQVSGLVAEGADEDDEYADDEDEDDAYDGPVSREVVEPPVPPGLGSPSASLNSLVEFLQLSPDLVAVAAERSAPLKRTVPSQKALEAWIGGLPAAEKDALLVRLAMGEGSLQAEVLRRFREETPSGSEPTATSGGRTVGELIAASKEHRSKRERREKERTARERNAHLDTLVGHEREKWRTVERLVDEKQARAYAEAVQILVDLRDLAHREGEAVAFRNELDDLRKRHARKTGFVDRLEGAGLTPS